MAAKDIQHSRRQTLAAQERNPRAFDQRFTLLMLDDVGGVADHAGSRALERLATVKAGLLLIAGGPAGVVKRRVGVIANRDPDRFAARMGRGRAPELVKDREWSTAGGRVTPGEGKSDRARRTDLNNAPAAVRSLAANRNRGRRSAKSMGTPRVVQHQPWEPLAAPHHTAELQRAVAQLLRLGTAEPPSAPEP